MAARKPPAGKSPATLAFDQRYFKRYYASQATRVVEPAHYTRLARFIAAYLDLLECPVSQVLDAGAGAGLFLRHLRRHYRDASCLGIDVSEYACTRHGWIRASIAEFSRGQYDLVICHDVLQYLPAREAEQALENLAKVCRGVLYFLALTGEDWRENCDQERTDGSVYLRSTQWYARRLDKHFRNAGGGVFLARRAGFTTWALHAAP